MHFKQNTNRYQGQEKNMDEFNHEEYWLANAVSLA